ncbi:MAG: stage III sporulation protein AC [Clostridia bacterium]|nr:stage III sporulation protein AC [Clostridia bacterium]
MDTDVIFKLAAIGLLVAIINQLLVKSGRDEQGLIVVISGLILAMLLMIDQIDKLFDAVRSTFGL